MLDNSTGKYFYDKDLAYHSSFVYAIQPSYFTILIHLLIRVTQDGFFTGSKDTTIMKVDLMGNPVCVYSGHEGAVNSLS